MKRAFLAVVLLLFVLLVGAGSYLAGYSAAQSSGDGEVAETAVVPDAPQTDQEREFEFEILRQALQIVEGEFYNPDALDHQKMLHGAIKGMLQTLDDPNTIFASPTEARIAEENLRGSFDGIGVQVEMREGRLTVVAPLEDTPGERAGLRPGDMIIEIDGESTEDLNLLEAVARIRGPRGTPVRLTIQREGEIEPFVVEIVRAEIRPVDVRARMLDEDIAYIRLSSFTALSGEEMAKALREQMRQNPRALVFDLRNNPGGLLHTAVDVAGQFLDDGVVVYEQRQGIEPKAYEAQKDSIASDLPMVVLVNRGSASASEIVAGALQDRGRAILIGESTFGKDTIQNVHSLQDKSSLRVTFARWWTPNRQDIQGKGLTPDILIPLTEEDTRTQRDPQLDEAVRYLLEMLAAQEDDRVALPTLR